MASDYPQLNLQLTEVDTPEQLETGPQLHWHRVDGLESDLVVHVLIERGEPPVIKCVQVAGDQVSTEDLRSIPLGRIERIFRSGATNGLMYHKNESGDWYIAQWLGQALTRRKSDETALEFAQRVAAAYRRYVAQTGHPAVAMAEDSGVPVGTVRRWIREARELKVLEPGTRGKAG